MTWGSSKNEACQPRIELAGTILNECADKDTYDIGWILQCRYYSVRMSEADLIRCCNKGVFDDLTLGVESRRWFFGKTTSKGLGLL